MLLYMVDGRIGIRGCQFCGPKRDGAELSRQLGIGKFGLYAGTPGTYRWKVLTFGGYKLKQNEFTLIYFSQSTGQSAGKLL